MRERRSSRRKDEHRSIEFVASGLAYFLAAPEKLRSTVSFGLVDTCRLARRAHRLWHDRG